MERTTSVLLGSGDHVYEVLPPWAKVPKGYDLREVSDVGVDSRDNVYAFTRGKHPVMVFSPNGDFLAAWGQGEFVRPHGLHIGPDDTLYCTDDGNHTVSLYTTEGKLKLRIGVPGEPSEPYSCKPFNRCTHTALSPEHDIYVADGYTNAAVHKYSPDGKLLFSWGAPGCDPGQFCIPHNICCDAQGFVYVADRENHRVQVFDGRGTFQAQWNNMHRPLGLGMRGGKYPLVYVGEMGPSYRSNRESPGLGPRISVYSKDGKLLTRLGTKKWGTARDQFIFVHGMAVDSKGALYVAELGQNRWDEHYPGIPEPADIDPLKKLVPRPAAG